MTVEVCLEPGAENHRAMWWRYAHVTQIAGTIACRDIHSPAECDGEVREILVGASCLRLKPHRPCRVERACS